MKSLCSLVYPKVQTFMIQQKENVERATNRRNVVLSLMNRHGYITKEEMNNAVKIPVTEGLQPSSEVTEMKYQAF